MQQQSSAYATTIAGDALDLPEPRLLGEKQIYLNFLGRQAWQGVV